MCRLVGKIHVHFDVIKCWYILLMIPAILCRFVAFWLITNNLQWINKEQTANRHLIFIFYSVISIYQRQCGMRGLPTLWMVLVRIKPQTLWSKWMDRRGLHIASCSVQSFFLEITKLCLNQSEWIYQLSHQFLL